MTGVGKPLAGQTMRTVAGASTITGDALPRLWIPAASRAATADRRHIITGVRDADIINVAAPPLPEDLRPIVKGLALGKPDVTVSRLLEMSPRTFSRRVAELLAFLEVETRFQAGAEVAQRWALR
jgi:hypothetical protein